MADTDIRTEETGAPTDLVGGMPATAGIGEASRLDDEERRTFAAIAEYLIPAAHGMPSAGEVVNDDRLAFVLGARPDLLEPLRAALGRELGSDIAARLAALGDQPTNLSALQLVIVEGYYTDDRVRELIGYPGQLAIDFDPWQTPPYVVEGLIARMQARGPVWRDPATGRRAQKEDRDGRDSA